MKGLRRDLLNLCISYASGVANGLSNVTQQIVKNSAKFGEEVDWRLAFYELQDITENAKLTVPVPSRLSIEGKLQQMPHLP